MPERTGEVGLEVMEVNFEVGDVFECYNLIDGCFDVSSRSVCVYA